MIRTYIRKKQPHHEAALLFHAALLLAMNNHSNWIKVGEHFTYTFYEDHSGSLFGGGRSAHAPFLLRGIKSAWMVRLNWNVYRTRPRNYA
jgi:hypothetical protein